MSQSAPALSLFKVWDGALSPSDVTISGCSLLCVSSSVSATHRLLTMSSVSTAQQWVLWLACQSAPGAAVWASLVLWSLFLWCWLEAVLNRQTTCWSLKFSSGSLPSNKPWRRNKSQGNLDCSPHGRPSEIRTHWLALNLISDDVTLLLLNHHTCLHDCSRKQDQRNNTLLLAEIIQYVQYIPIFIASLRHVQGITP